MQRVLFALLVLVLLLAPVGCSRGPALNRTDSVQLGTVEQGQAPLVAAPSAQPLELLDPVLPLDLQPGAPQLVAERRPDDGWQVTATPDSLVGLGDLDISGPTGLYWTGSDRALFRWRRQTAFDLIQMDLKTGELATLKGFQDVESGSPGGRFLVLRFGETEPRFVADLQTAQVIYEVPAGSHALTWLSDERFLLGGSQRALLVDAAAKQVWEVPERTVSAVALNGELCYASDQVLCFHPGEEEGRLLLPAEAGRSDRLSPLVADPTGRWLAFGYRRNLPKASWHPLGGTAYASKPLPPMTFVDTLLLYDSESGNLRHLALPEPVMVNQLVWSPDGAYVGLALHPAQEEPWNAVHQGAIWLLEVATGQMERLLAYDTVSAEWGGTIMQVRPDGSVLLVSDRPELYAVRQLAPGAKPQVWEGRRLLALNPPGPPWVNGVPSQQFTVVESDRVTVHTAQGDSLTWRVSDDLPRAHALPDPAYRWLSVQVTNQGTSGRLLFVPRSH